VTFRKSVVPAALAFAGCLPTESELPPPLEQLTYQTPTLSEDCDIEQVNYHLYAQIVRQGSAQKSATSSGALLVTLSESTTVVACDEDLVRVATPGAELAAHSFASNSERVTVDVPGMLIGGHRPSIRVEALLDTNDNGECDDGELFAAVDADPRDLATLTLDLTADSCIRRQ